MSTIQLRTPIPGPRSRALGERRAKAVPRGLSHGTPVYVAKAEDAWLEDVDGNRYLDFAGGIGCLNVGHRRDEVLEAVRAQLDHFLHTCVQVTPYESYVRLAERLNEVTPGKFAKKTIFLNSGAEAVENAVKIARAYTKRPALIAFNDAFHGRTMMTLALTSKTHPYKAGFEPFPGDVYRIPYAYCYRCSYGLTYPSCKLTCAHALEDAFKRMVAPESVAAVNKGSLPADVLARLDAVAALLPRRPFEEPMILPFNDPDSYSGPGMANLGAGIPVGRLR